MPTYTCEKCARIFKQKSGYNDHMKKKIDCTTVSAIAPIIEEMKEIKRELQEMKKEIEYVEAVEPLEAVEPIDYSNKKRPELNAICRERKIKGYSTMKIGDIRNLLSNTPKNEIIIPAAIPVVIPTQIVPVRQDVIHGDTLVVLPTLEDNSAQIIIADPPYNIGKDFGNDSDKQPMDQYLIWSEKWIKECLRILKPNGTMFIYGFSEILALILSKVPYDINRRWIIWHYTNKNVASLNFWQRSHESILVLWKNDKVFHRDDIREAYTEGFLNGAAGKERTATKGRFSKGDKTTTYTAHPNGALPRDVIKIPALAGGAGMKERVNHPTQKPIAICEKLLRSCKQPNTEGYVLIPFAGSGSECVASKNIGLPFVGIELNEEYVKLINERLKDDILD